MIVRDISIVEWRPLPAPPGHFLLVRYFEDGRIFSDVAFSENDGTFSGPDDRPFDQKNRSLGVPAV